MICTAVLVLCCQVWLFWSRCSSTLHRSATHSVLTRRHQPTTTDEASSPLSLASYRPTSLPCSPCTPARATLVSFNSTSEENSLRKSTFVHNRWYRLEPYRWTWNLTIKRLSWSCDSVQLAAKTKQAYSCGRYTTMISHWSTNFHTAANWWPTSSSSYSQICGRVVQVVSSTRSGWHDFHRTVTRRVTRQCNAIIFRPTCTRPMSGPLTIKWKLITAKPRWS